MSFLCPARLKAGKNKDGGKVTVTIPSGRVTGSTSLDTIVQVEAAKQSGAQVCMVVTHDFEPCVADEIHVERGQQVSVLYQENDWLYVTTKDNKEGFIPYNYCLPLQRSVDDFNKVVQKSDKVKKVPGRPPDSHEQKVSTTVELDASTNVLKTKSMPDIAKPCDQTSTSHSSLPVDTKHHDSTCRNATCRGTEVQLNHPSCHIVADHRTCSRTSVTSRCEGSSSDVRYLPDSDSRTSKPASDCDSRQHRSIKHDHHNHSDVKPRTRSLDRVDCGPQSISRYKPSRSSVRTTWSDVPHGYKHRSHSHHHHHHHHQYNPAKSSAPSRSQNKLRANKPDVLPPTPAGSLQSSSSATSVISRHWAPPPVKHTDPKRQPIIPNALPPEFPKDQTLVHTSFPDPHTAQTGPTSHFAKTFHGKFMVLYDYSAVEEDDISIRRGEVVAALNVTDSNWTWAIRSDRKEGFVPSRYLRSISSFRQHEPSATHNTSQRHTTSKQTSPSSNTSAEAIQSSTPQQVHSSDHSMDLFKYTKLVCLYNYTAQSPDDLTVQRGDWLYADFHNQTDTTWLWVYSSVSHRSGFVPRSYVKQPNFGIHENDDAFESGNVRNIRAHCVNNRNSAPIETVLDPFTSP